MNRIIFLLIVLPLVLSAKTIKIATYNVENLFDMQLSGLEYREYIPGLHNWTEPVLAKKLKNIAEVICDLDADVIALQEVENDHILKRLQRVLDRAGCDYRYRAITSSKQTPIHNAILSKIPLKKRKDIVIYRNGKHRSILEVDLKLEPKLKIFANHWKSKAGPESERIVYARALMKRIDALPKGSEYIILGDFNADYDEYRTIEQKHNDTGGRTGINHILRTIREGKPIRIPSLTEGYHCNLWLELPVYARWSHNFYGKKEGLDAIIIPAVLNDGDDWEYQKDSFGVFKPDYLFGRRGRINRWQYRKSKHAGKGYSDHLPVYASFETGGGRSKKGSSFMDSLLSLFSFYTGSQKDTVQEVIVPDAKTKETTIAEIYAMDSITTPVVLKNAKVIFKRGDSAVIKQSREGRAILLYRCAGELEEGRAYDITAYRKKIYRGLDELVDISVEKDIGRADTDAMRGSFRPEMMLDKRYINEVVSEVEGVYRNRKIEIAGEAYAIYFKKRVKRPENGSRIMLKRAIIGYYKDHNELTVWGQDDYHVKE